MTPLVDLVVSRKLAVSKSEARRLITQGCILVNGQRVTEVGAAVADKAEVRSARKERS